MTAEKSNVDPALQRWAIAFCARERGRADFETATATLHRERDAAVAAIRYHDGRSKVSLLDGTVLEIGIVDGEPWVFFMDRQG